jgi:hypothetical protein
MKAMKQHMGARPRWTDRSIDAFEGRPGADDLCGEALFDTLFDRAPATDHAADQDSGGLFATHPRTADRIVAPRRMP